jgi:hypothetical protein
VNRNFDFAPARRVKLPGTVRLSARASRERAFTPALRPARALPSPERRD